MVFVSVWFSFAGALLLLNMQHKRRIYDSIPNFGRWKALILLVAGFIGGEFLEYKMIGCCRYSNGLDWIWNRYMLILCPYPTVPCF